MYYRILFPECNLFKLQFFFFYFLNLFYRYSEIEIIGVYLGITYTKS